jgi:hypothetical protein
MFAPTRSTRGYCSNRCRQAAYRQRIRDTVEQRLATIDKYAANVSARVHRKDQAQRRMKLVRAAVRGDADAIAELKREHDAP